MLEILLVWTLAKKIGNTVRAKGHSRWPYQFLLVVLWVGGEVVGGVMGVVLQAGDQGEGGFPIMTYVCALAGAGIGAGVAFIIANSLAGLKTDDDFYRQDELDRLRDDEVRRTWRGPADQHPDGDAIKQGPADRRADDRVQE